ncbi:HPP family protein [Bradyrhizobium sp. STM 3562]|uniref:CBS domain-containing protein n=1 Tax=Bradyrhizobium sp. STM 3562 TaxID=578924 RepID=UPI00388F922F
MYRFLEETAGTYMTREVKTVTRDLTIDEVNGMFARDDFNTYPVEEDGQAVGIITKFDLLKCFAFTPNQMVPRYAELMVRTVADIMTTEFIYVRPDTKLTRVLQLMVQHRIRSIPVIDFDQHLAGIISREDVLKALAVAALDP